MDLLLCGITIVLTFFGLAMIASVSVYKSYQVTSQQVDRGLREEPTNSYYLVKSSIHVLVGFLFMFLLALVPYRMWERFALPLFGFTMLLLITVFLPGIAAEHGTSRSWIIIGGFSFQPAELLKLTLIFYLAVWLQKREAQVATLKEGFLPFVTLLLISCVLVAVQPDFGSFLVLSCIAMSMFFVAGGNIVQMLLGAAISTVFALPIILNYGYVQRRFLGFLSILFATEPMVNICQVNSTYQVCQALAAIGSGGMFGVGYGKSIQKFGYLPEVQADMIFAVMSEELGLMRILIIMGMFGIFVWRGYRAAVHAPDRFGFLVATGITSWIAFQTLINIGVNTSIFPLTGLTLPFISAGGSSLITLLAAVGVLLNISSYSTEEAVQERRSRIKPRLLTW